LQVIGQNKRLFGCSACVNYKKGKGAGGGGMNCRRDDWANLRKMTDLGKGRREEISKTRGGREG